MIGFYVIGFYRGPSHATIFRKRMQTYNFMHRNKNFSYSNSWSKRIYKYSFLELIFAADIAADLFQGIHYFLLNHSKIYPYKDSAQLTPNYVFHRLIKETSCETLRLFHLYYSKFNLKNTMYCYSFFHKTRDADVVVF